MGVPKHVESIAGVQVGMSFEGIDSFSCEVHFKYPGSDEWRNVPGAKAMNPKEAKDIVKKILSLEE